MVWPAGICPCSFPGRHVAAIMSHDLRGLGWPPRLPAGRAVQMRCLACGVETAEATPACLVCGAPAPRQPNASAWSDPRAWATRVLVRQRQLRVKQDPVTGANVPPGPGDPEDSTAGPPDSDSALFAERVRATRFSATRLRPGYDMEDVDAFLEAIRDTFLGIREPSLTPGEIRTKRFSTTRLRPGYDEEEVDAFLDEAELRLAALAGARADAARQRSVAAEPAADPAAAQPAGRGGPSRRLLITAGVAAALVTVGGLIAGLDHPGPSTSSISSTSSVRSTGQLTVAQLRAGDCLQGSGQTLEDFSQGNGPFTGIPCTQLHTAEVFFAGNAWPRSRTYPGDQAVYDDGHARCVKAFRAYDGIDSSASAFEVVFSTPDSSTWPDGDRRLVCFASSAPGWVDYSIQGLGQ